MSGGFSNDHPPARPDPSPSLWRSGRSRFAGAKLTIAVTPVKPFSVVPRSGVATRAVGQRLGPHEADSAGRVGVEVLARCIASTSGRRASTSALVGSGKAATAVFSPLARSSADRSCARARSGPPRRVAVRGAARLCALRAVSTDGCVGPAVRQQAHGEGLSGRPRQVNVDHLRCRRRRPHVGP